MTLEEEKKYWENFDWEQFDLDTREGVLAYGEKEKERFDFRRRLEEAEYNSPEMVEERKRKLQEKRNRNISTCGIGDRYLSVTLSDFQIKSEEQQNVINNIKQFISHPEGKSLWMVGNAGTGKTMLCAVICYYLGGRYVKSYEIEDELEMARSFSAKENIVEVIKRYSEYRLLIIDEIGKMKSQNENRYLFKILNERYEKEIPTVLVSNLKKTDLANLLGKPLVDRFNESCKCLEFNWPSFRSNLRNNWDSKIDEKIFE